MNKFKNSKKNNYPHAGFTLIEILAVMAIFITISGLILSIVFISLRASKKSDVIISARQNADIAMSQMVGMMRFAKNLDSPASCLPAQNSLSYITITSADDNQITLSCPSTPTETIASNGASLMDSSSVSVSDCSFSCSQLSTFDFPNITIRFTLSTFNGGNLLENNITIPFQTSVTMRNYRNF